MNSVHWKHEQCTLETWTVYTRKMNSVHWKHGQCTLETWTVYTGNMDSVHWKYEKCTLETLIVYTGYMNSVHWTFSEQVEYCSVCQVPISGVKVTLQGIQATALCDTTWEVHAVGELTKHWMTFNSSDFVRT